MVFLVLAAIFFLIMIYLGHDISSRTTWPGSKPQLIERVFHENENSNIDSTEIDKDSTVYDPK